MCFFPYNKVTPIRKVLEEFCLLALRKACPLDLTPYLHATFPYFCQVLHTPVLVVKLFEAECGLVTLASPQQA